MIFGEVVRIEHDVCGDDFRNINNIKSLISWESQNSFFHEVDRVSRNSGEVGHMEKFEDSLTVDRSVMLQVLD